MSRLEEDILKRNVADLEIALKQQTERADAAQAAINAVGAEELVFTANFLAGNITLADLQHSLQHAAQTGEQ